MVIGKRIQKLRGKQNMLQSELAEKLNVGRTTISNYENGYSSPDLQMVIKMAKLFNVSTDYLLGVSEKQHGEIDFSNTETRLLYYYRRLSYENRDYIIGEMIRLYRKK